jgi:hypothetical protein
MNYEITAATVRHIKPMAAKLRAAACMTLSKYGYEPRRALHRVFRASFYCRTALVYGKPAAMWGVTGTVMSETACVWLVLSDQIAAIPRSIVQEAKRELSVIMQHYSEVATTVLPDDDAAIRFAIYLGFHDREDDVEISRKLLEKEIRESPRYRIPVGDSYVIRLGYHARAVQ